MYQRVGLLLLHRRVRPAREVSKDRPEHSDRGSFRITLPEPIHGPPCWTPNLPHKPARTPAAGLFVPSLNPPPPKVFVALWDLSLL